MTSPPHIEARDLWFAYESRGAALRGVSLRVPPGAFLALIGQNGSGKTTLAKHFNGLLQPGSGRVWFDGEDIRGRSVGDLARQVGYLFQNPDQQIFCASTREEIAFGPRNLGLAEVEVRRRTEEALERFRLVPYADHQPARLSFGLRRKVTMAAVYAMQTPILILDEPTTGLDWRSAAELMDLIRARHARGHSVVLITHDMRLVAEYAPVCVVLHEGQVVAQDATRAVFLREALLRETRLEPPQIARLSRRLAPLGMPGDRITVEAFCEAYAGRLAAGRPEG